MNRVVWALLTAASLGLVAPTLAQPRPGSFGPGGPAGPRGEGSDVRKLEAEIEKLASEIREMQSTMRRPAPRDDGWGRPTPKDGPGLRTERPMPKEGPFGRPEPKEMRSEQPEPKKTRSFSGTGAPPEKGPPFARSRPEPKEMPFARPEPKGTRSFSGTGGPQPPMRQFGGPPSRGPGGPPFAGGGFGMGPGRPGPSLMPQPPRPGAVSVRGRDISRRIDRIVSELEQLKRELEQSRR